MLPIGKVEFSEFKVGDPVAMPDGQTYRVTEVFPAETSFVIARYDGTGEILLNHAHIQDESNPSAKAAADIIYLGKRHAPPYACRDIHLTRPMLAESAFSILRDYGKLIFDKVEVASEEIRYRGRVRRFVKGTLLFTLEMRSKSDHDVFVIKTEVSTFYRKSLFVNKIRFFFYEDVFNGDYGSTVLPLSEQKLSLDSPNTNELRKHFEQIIGLLIKP